MIAERLEASHFRNIVSCDISFVPGVNVLLGQNAQGKTNALECMYLFARGKSFRAGSDKELVQFGERGFSAQLTFTDQKRTQTLAIKMQDGVRRRTRNGAEVSKAGEMIGHFRAVMFCPDHLLLVKGGPEERRAFLNVAISQFDRLYVTRYARFLKILDNRNFLLKCAKKGQYFSEEELDTWTYQLAEVSAAIATTRMAYVKRLSPYTETLMTALSGGKEHLKIAYEGSIMGEGEEDIKAGYLAAFASHRDKEILAGCSLFGVHRDDLRLEIDGTDARNFASQGQQRSVVLTLKLAEGEVCKDICGEYPVYLFDDVLSELDEGRRAFILSGAEDKQFIVTSCEKDLFSNAHAIYVSDGHFLDTLS